MVTIGLDQKLHFLDPTLERFDLLYCMIKLALMMFFRRVISSTMLSEPGTAVSFNPAGNQLVVGFSSGLFSLMDIRYSKVYVHFFCEQRV